MRTALLFFLSVQLAFATTPPSTDEAAVPVVVIAHPDVPERDVSLSELRKIFLGDRQFWTGEMRVVLLVPPARSGERATLLEKVYEKTESQYRHYWIAKVFRTEAQTAPKVAKADSAVELVRQIPGAIAVIDASRVPAGIKVLRVDGKNAGDPGYPLR
jgi:ABC-type phosphate transport system substrate-binding protein